MTPHLGMNAAWAQIPGTRDYQEDDVALTRWPNGFHLLVLADGVGGNYGGREASRVVVRSVRDHFASMTGAGGEGEGDPVSENTASPLKVAVLAANAAIRDAVEENRELDGMASTVVAATFDGETLRWISVGDSLVCLFRQNRLYRLNADHSMNAELARRVAMGEITAEEAAHSPERNQLLSAIMGEEVSIIDEPLEQVTTMAGDILLLASDGLLVLGMQGMESTLKENIALAPDRIADALLAAVEDLDRPSQDNTTVVVASITVRDDSEGGA